MWEAQYHSRPNKPSRPIYMAMYLLLFLILTVVICLPNSSPRSLHLSRFHMVSQQIDPCSSWSLLFSFSLFLILFFLSSSDCPCNLLRFYLLSPHGNYQQSPFRTSASIALRSPFLLAIVPLPKAILPAYFFSSATFHLPSLTPLETAFCLPPLKTAFRLFSPERRLQQKETIFFLRSFTFFSLQRKLHFRFFLEGK